MTDFTFKIVDSSELLEKVYHLRFQVYVKECCFISAEDCRDKKETDKFDEYSIHLAALDRKGNVVGAVRLVLDSPFGFPLEEHCEYPILNGKKYKLDRRNITEISRLVISKRYRRGQLNGHYNILNSRHSEGAQREFSYRISPILFGLYKVGYQESIRRNVTHWIAAMEDSLFRLVSALGFIFHTLGEPIEYYGKIIPCLGILEEIEKNIPSQKYPISEHIFAKCPLQTF